MSISVTSISTLSIQGDPTLLYYVSKLLGSSGLQIAITYYTILATTIAYYARITCAAVPTVLYLE